VPGFEDALSLQHRKIHLELVAEDLIIYDVDGGGHSAAATPRLAAVEGC
jgi:hypothetical protein